MSAGQFLRDGLARHQANDLDGALAFYEKALALDPVNADALHLSGLVHFARGALALAAALIGRAIAVQPGFAAAHNHLGLVLAASNDVVGARRAYEQAIAADANLPEARLNLGSLERRLGHFAAAEMHYRAALTLRPGYAEAHFNLGNLLREQRDLAGAIAAYLAAIDNHPALVDAHNNLANVLAEVGQRRRAAEHFAHALALQPGNADVHHNLGNFLLFSGDVAGAKLSLGNATALAPDAPQFHSSLLFALSFDEETEAPALLEAHRSYNERFIKPLREARPTSYPALVNKGRDPARKLRLAYLSHDFRLHPGGHFLLPVVRHHDRQQFEVFCYATDASDDVNRRTFRQLADQFIEARALDDAALASRIHADEIDILIDCMGHLEGSRLGVFGRAPAPVQVSFPIYPATTGVETIGWRIMDPYFGPAEADGWHSERLVRLPDAHVCYQPLDQHQTPPAPNATLPMDAKGHITFGSFNNAAKLGPRTASAFARIVNAVPGARLALKWHGLEECDAVLARFEAAGLDRGRIDLLGWSESPYAPYLGIDIALDPLLANGGTTTCDALYMGVPVVSCVGARPFARVGLCHLTNIGLPELVAPTEDEFISLAIGLARDLTRLRHLRQGLRERFLASPLCDQRRYVANLDRAYRQIWQEFVAGTSAATG